MEGGVEGVEVVEDTAKTKDDDTCSRGESGSQDVTDHRQSVKEGGVKNDWDGASGDVKGGTKTGRDVSDELIQLKLELNHQVQRLYEICTRKIACGGREEEERERRRSAEQVAVMARKLYGLQHQVGVAMGVAAHKAVVSNHLSRNIFLFTVYLAGLEVFNYCTTLAQGLMNILCKWLLT